MKQIKILLFLMVAVFFASCEKETPSDSNQLNIESEITNRSSHKTWNRVSWEELQGDIHFLEIASNLGLEQLYQGSQIDMIALDSSTISKCSDIVNDYYSFTFPVHSDPDFPDVVRNVVLEKKGRAYKANVVEYSIGFDDLYALMTNTFTNPINIPVDIYPIDPNTIEFRECWWVTIQVIVPCPCQGHTNPSFCSCGTQPLIYSFSNLECDDDPVGGNDDGINIHPNGELVPTSGGGGGPGVGDDNGDNSGTELLMPTYEWYLIKLEKLINDYDLEIEIEDLEDIVPIECMGGGNPLIGEFEECAGKALLEDLHDDVITDVLLKDGYIMGIGQDGSLKIYFPDVPDPADLTKQDLFDRTFEVVNCVNLYFCETEEYEPIDWSDYFDNVNGGGYVVNWDDNVTFESCPVTMILDFSWGTNVMDTSPGFYGQTSDSPPINNWKWTGVDSDFTILQIGTKSIGDCKDTLYDFFNPDCE